MTIMDTLVEAEGHTIPVEIGEIKQVRFVELLGVGGFGAAWHVEDPTTSRAYTLKIIHGVEPGSVEAARVRMEAEVTIPSPYVVCPVGLREWNPSTFLILFDYFESTSLDRLIESNALTPEQRRDVYVKTLYGVADAHRANVIHRDLKPSNILVSRTGDVRVIDFGISKFKDRKRLTADGTWLGTMPYIAPEVFFEGAHLADGRVDLYALGHILYELTTGRHFWTIKGWRGLEDFAHFVDQAPPPYELIETAGFTSPLFPDVDAGAVLSRMVRREPGERFGSVDEVLTALGVTPPPTCREEEAPPGPRLSAPLLVVETGTNSGARTVLALTDGETWEIGRAHIAGNDQTISRRHFWLQRRGERFFITDAGSKHGTLVNGRALAPGGEAHQLASGDHIKAGDVFLRFTHYDAR